MYMCPCFFYDLRVCYVFDLILLFLEREFERGGGRAFLNRVPAPAGLLLSNQMGMRNASVFTFFYLRYCGAVLIACGPDINCGTYHISQFPF